MVGGEAARRQRGSRGAGFAGWRCGAGRRRTNSEISIGAHISILRAGGGAFAAVASAMRAVVAVMRNSMLALDVEDDSRGIWLGALAPQDKLERGVY